ncbi:hypothetical protein D9758_010646 [Tetrapyrgos nigripes]|uniref:Uncharacterized protein n=1 Tax=Tetrapyrgos nigripes TaxID=182062 RepID=A0A8H5GGG3_9AGAR|nr:hypothetical protein D9758_010646 [Tetrapyrgos nigripes]
MVWKEKWLGGLGGVRTRFVWDETLPAESEAEWDTPLDGSGSYSHSHSTSTVTSLSPTSVSLSPTTLSPSPLTTAVDVDADADADGVNGAGGVNRTNGVSGAGVVNGNSTNSTGTDSITGDTLGSHIPSNMSTTLTLTNRQEVDLRTACQVYFVETRAMVQDVVILMNLQLYMIDSINYLVDFHHKKSYLASRRPGAGKYEPAGKDEIRSFKDFRNFRDGRDWRDGMKQMQGLGLGQGQGQGRGRLAGKGRPSGERLTGEGDFNLNDQQHPSSPRLNPTTTNSGSGGSLVTKGKEGAGARDDNAEVVSPYVFMDVACRLILELAGGGRVGKIRFSPVQRQIFRTPD